MTSQAEKAAAFAALHESGTFIVANPWDVGSARLLQALGFNALATTSSGFAMSLGRLDGQVTLDEKLAHCQALCAATDIPITADLENGFGDEPEQVAQTIRLAAQTGLAGGSIEDYTGNSQLPIYPQSLAVERIEAAVAAARGLPVPFVLTARAEQMLRAERDLDATIARLQAYERAGADVLYAPGLRSLDEVAAICQSVSKPLNVLISPMPDIGLTQLAELGVRRISVGGALAYATFRPLLDAAYQMLERGRFDWLNEIAEPATIRALLKG